MMNAAKTGPINSHDHLRIERRVMELWPPFSFLRFLGFEVEVVLLSNVKPPVRGGSRAEKS